MALMMLGAASISSNFFGGSCPPPLLMNPAAVAVAAAMNGGQGHNQPPHQSLMFGDMFNNVHNNPDPLPKMSFCGAPIGHSSSSSASTTPTDSKTALSAAASVDFNVLVDHQHEQGRSKRRLEEDENLFSHYKKASIESEMISEEQPLDLSANASEK